MRVVNSVDERDLSLATDVWMTLLSQSLGVHGNSAAAVLEDGGNGERTYSWAGLCCAHGHGAYPHQCRDQTDSFFFIFNVVVHSRSELM